MEQRELIVDLIAGFRLIRDYFESILFPLIGIEGGGVDSGYACKCEAAITTRVSPWDIWNLEPVISNTKHQAQTTLIIEQVREIAETLALFSFVVKGVFRGRRIFDSQIIAQKRAGQKERERTR